MYFELSIQFTLDLYKNIFEKEFKGVLPVEILIDTKRKKGVMKISTLKKMDELQSEIEAIPELSKPVSIVNLVKFSKQAYYNGNPAFYDLPDSQEQAFILPYLKNSSKDSKNNPLKSYVDSTGQYARISTFMREVSTDEMVKVEEKLNDRINKLFPKERFTVTITGKALSFMCPLPEDFEMALAWYGLSYNNELEQRPFDSAAI